MWNDMHWLSIDPVDSCFFRDGRPMHMGESSVTASESIFPPSPLTTGGALRAALARANGWTHGKRWPEGLRPILGADEELGSARFAGPFLTRNAELLFPCPLHILGKDEPDVEGTRWSPLVAMRPGSGVHCDLGPDVRLPELPPEHRGQTGLKPGEGWFVTTRGLQSILAGQLPEIEQIIPERNLWTNEFRTGNRLQESTRTTENDALYSTRHTRTHSGTGLVIAVGGLPREWQLPTGLHPFGGEGRMAEIAPLSQSPQPPVSGAAPYKNFMLVLLSPLMARHENILPRGNLPGLGKAEIVCVCTGKASRVGGWNFTRHSPLPRKPVYPAGTVIFCRQSPSDEMNTDSFLYLGESTDYGFGLAVVGTWNDYQE